MSIGVGKAYIASPIGEASRLKAAINKLKEEYKAIYNGFDCENKDVFLWYIAVLEDEVNLSEMLSWINSGKTAETAVNKAFDSVISELKKNESEVFSSRADDLTEIKNSLLENLASLRKTDYSKVPSGSVLVVKNLTPTAVGKISENKISAVVSQRGTPLSHAAILAKSKGIPVVFSPKNFGSIEEGDVLIVNSENKSVIIDKYKN